METVDLLRLYDSLPCGIALFNDGEPNPFYVNKALETILNKEESKIKKNFNGCFLNIDKPLTENNEQLKAYLSKDGTIWNLMIQTKLITLDGRSILRAIIDYDQQGLVSLTQMTDGYGYATAIIKTDDKKLEVLYANQQFYQLIGQDEKEFLLNPFGNSMQLVNESELTKVTKSITDSLTSGTPKDMLTWIKQKDGKVIWVSQRLGAYKTVNGSKILLIILQDVTKVQKENEKEEYKNECYRMIIDQTDTAVFEWNLKDNTFDSTPSYSKYAMSRVNPSDILHNQGPLDLVYPEDYPALKKFFEETNDMLKASTTIRIKMVDGTFRWSQLAGLFIKDVFGNKVRVIGTINDIDDDKQKAVMMDSMMNAIPGGIALFAISQEDPLLTLKYCSEGFYRLSDRTKAQLDIILAKKIPLEKSIIPLDRERFVNTLREKALKGEPINVIVRYYDVHKNICWVHMTASKIREVKGVPEYYAILTKPTNEAISYRSLVESSNLATFVAEKKTSRIIFVNDAWRKLAKVDLKKKVDGLTLKDLHLENQRSLSYDEIQDLPSGEFKFFHLETNNGYYLYVQARSIMWNNIEAYILYISDETQQKTIQAKNERNQALLNAASKIANVSVWEMDVKEKKIYQTELTQKLHGFDIVIENAPEVFFQGDYISDTTKPDLAKMYHEVFNGKASQAIIQFRQPPTNEYHWEKLMCEPVFDSEHKVIKVIGTSLPFDEFMERQQRYDEQMKVNWALARSSLAMIYIDLSNNEILEAQSEVPQIAKLFTKGNADAVHIALSKLMASSKEQKDHLNDTSAQALLAAYQEGKTLLRFNYRLSILPGWYEAIYSLILNPRTHHIEAVCILRDNTAERQTELIVNKLAETNYDGIYTINSLTGTNKPYTFSQEMLKNKPELSMEDAIHKYCKDVDDISRVQKENSLSTIKRHLATKQVYVTFFFIRVEGKIMRKRAMYCYLLDDHSEILAAVQDYTTSYRQQAKQQEKLEEALAQAKNASEAKSDFLSNMSHEIRTPMNAIIGMTKLAKEEMETNPQAAKEYLDQIDKSSNYLLGLLNDILDMSRIEKNKLELHKEWIGSEETLKSCFQMIKPMMEQKNITFTYHKPDDEFLGYELYIDGLRVKQILMNLLNNAVKFTADNGKVSLKIEKVKESNNHRTDRITITDNGCGMSKDFIKRTFQPFSQEQNAFSNQVQGTGLGLALTKNIVTAMGGSIKIESELNKGTKVIVLLPYRFRVKEKMFSKDEPIYDESVLKGKHILLCEDRPLNAIIAGKLLEKKGMLITNAVDGQEALEQFEKSKVGYYVAILMDIRMPRLNGLEATKAIRELKRKDAKEVPIIAMTANAFLSDQQASKKAGMNAHLSKPIQPDLLYQTLAKHLQK